MKKSTLNTILSSLGRKNGKKRNGKTKNLSVFVLGAANTGKSSIINVLCDEEFSDAYSPTKFDIYEKELVGAGNNNPTVKFVFFDISGKDSCAIMRREYIRKADIFLLVYSADQPSSYKQLLRYKTEIEQVKEDRISELSVAIIRNKTDLETKKVDEKKLAWCRSVYHCSAKYGHNISHLTEFLTTESLCAGNIIEQKLNKGLSGRYIYADNDQSKSIRLIRPKSYYKHHEGEESSEFCDDLAGAEGGVGTPRLLRR